MGGHKESSKKPEGLLYVKPTKPKRRICLRCRKTFKSVGSGNRVCPKCNKHNQEIKISLRAENPDQGRKIVSRRRGGVRD